MSDKRKVKVDKNVEIPSPQWGNNRIYPWKEMEVEDSFFIPLGPGEDIAKLQRSINSSSRSVCKRITRRRTEKGVLGVRAWRKS